MVLPCADGYDLTIEILVHHVHLLCHSGLLDPLSKCVLVNALMRANHLTRVDVNKVSAWTGAGRFNNSITILLNKITFVFTKSTRPVSVVLFCLIAVCTLIEL